MIYRICFAVLLTCICLFLPSLIPDQTSVVSLASPEAGPKADETISGPEWQRRFFARWHQPYGAVLPVDIQTKMTDEVWALPSETQSESKETWQLVGPVAIRTDAGAFYTGRVLDMETTNGTPNKKIASASGGLWNYNAVVSDYTPLTEDLSSQWIGSVAVHPDNEDIIIIGTGEYGIHSGTGVFKSVDAGASWYKLNFSPSPSTVFRIRFAPQPNLVHAATVVGYFRSTDGGESWTRTYSGVTTDLALHPTNSNILYMTVSDEGLFRSDDGGITWVKETASVIPTSGVKRGAVSICAADPEVVYVAFAYLDTNNDHVMKGIYKTVNGGEAWYLVSPSANYMGDQGWYNNVIAVSPTDPNTVLAGGVGLLRTSDGGSTWSIVSDDDLHVDYHAIQWLDSGTVVYVGNDGGWYYSTNAGWSGTWHSAWNTMPITQFTEFDCRGVFWGSAALCGGSQDNGIATSYDGGFSWNLSRGADGGGISFGPDHFYELYYAAGLFGGDLLFRRFYSGDGGLTEQDISPGIEPSTTWYPAMRMDADGSMYTHSGNHVHRRTRDDLTWQSLTPGGFGSSVLELTVCPVVDAPVVYACLNSDNDYRLYVRDLEWWSERSDGLPTGRKIRKVVPHPTNSMRAYALINGLGSPDQKIFLTNDRGHNWTNITGDLPNVPLADLVVHPTSNQRLYLGSGLGCFRTTNGGANWERWNEGMPEAVVVSEMKGVDMRTFGHGYHVVAATYGRSIWRRNIESVDVTSVREPGQPSGILVHPATPNPFNAQTVIAFEIPKEYKASLRIYDMSGSLVKVLLDNQVADRGRNEVIWQGKDASGRTVPSGVYFYCLEVGSFRETKRMLLVK